jgi:hypothetical protein
MEEELMRPGDAQPETESKLPVSESEAAAAACVDEPKKVAGNEVYSSESVQNEEKPMIEVHSPHESVHTWKDVFIHIGIVTVGLLLAIGLEQTVEYFHHRHQVVETRKALLIEKQVNIRRFTVETDDFYRVLPILQKNLAIYQYLRQHPGAPKEKWPGKVSWALIINSYIDSEWKTAQESNVLQYMPQSEVRHYAMLYRRLDALNDLNQLLAAASGEVRLMNIQEPNAGKLSAAQLDEQISKTARLLMALGRCANAQRNLNAQFSEFKPTPTPEAISSITHAERSPEDMAKIGDEVRRILESDKGLGEDEVGAGGEGK